MTIAAAPYQPQTCAWSMTRPESLQHPSEAAIRCHSHAALRWLTRVVYITGCPPNSRGPSYSSQFCSIILVFGRTNTLLRRLLFGSITTSPPSFDFIELSTHSMMYSQTLLGQNEQFSPSHISNLQRSFSTSRHQRLSDSTPRSPFAFGVPYKPNTPQNHGWEYSASQYFPSAFGDCWYSHDGSDWNAYQRQNGSYHPEFPDSPPTASTSLQARPRSNSAMYIPNHDGLPINLSLGAVFTESRGIFVGNLSYNTQWKDLKEYLSVAGRVIRCDVPQGPNGKGKGYATVLFETPEEALNACEIFNGHPYMGRQLRVRIDKFAPTSGTGESGGRLKPTKVVGRF